MTDLSAGVTKPGQAGSAPNYQPVSATDFFVASRGGKYMLHYKNGATPTGAGSFKIGDPTTPIPSGSGAAAGFADVVVQNAGMNATTELVAWIDNADRHRDSNGRINLAHVGTLTTVTVAIMGPF